MSDEKHGSSPPSTEEGSRGHRSGSGSEGRRIKRKKKKKKGSGSGRIPSELGSRVVTIILILLGALFIFSLYYIVVNLNVKTSK